jgi:hypothetical protein
VETNLWESLPKTDIARDVEESTEWISSELNCNPPATGVYLGLDTLNMDGPNGFNVEIGRATGCDPMDDDTSWTFESLSYGKSHLIRGLKELQSVYSRPEWSGELFTFADYVLFLGYSGIVLGRALSQLPLQNRIVAVWGFHDGDIFILGRRTPQRFEFVCK